MLILTPGLNRKYRLHDQEACEDDYICALSCPVSMTAKWLDQKTPPEVER